MDQHQARFLSLDVFRGLTICFMIIVNTPGSGATPFAALQHAAWHGFTPTDLVFPSFLFAVGNALSFSMIKLRTKASPPVLKKIFKRTVLIFLIGYLMYWFPFYGFNPEGKVVLSPISQTRILGVLQRIALCYCAAALLVYYFRKKTVLLISAIILLAYWTILLIFGDPSDPLGMSGNAGTHLDKLILGDGHLYHGEGIPFDPEGILGTFPAIVNVIVGYYAGEYIQKKGRNYEGIARLMLWGALFIFAALCWNGLFPINKKLWTSSFVLLTTGIDLLIISILVYWVEIQQHQDTLWVKFLEIPGKNPLLLYVLSEILATLMWRIPMKEEPDLYKWISIHWYQYLAPGPTGSLLFALTVMMICWLIGWLLNKNKIYIRV